jgi:hypothetical protein
MDRTATALPLPEVELSDPAASRIREALAQEAGASVVRIDVGIG